MLARLERRLPSGLYFAALRYFVGGMVMTAIKR